MEVEEVTTRHGVAENDSLSPNVTPPTPPNTTLGVPGTNEPTHNTHKSELRDTDVIDRETQVAHPSLPDTNTDVPLESASAQTLETLPSTTAITSTLSTSAPANFAAPAASDTPTNRNLPADVHSDSGATNDDELASRAKSMGDGSGGDSAVNEDSLSQGGGVIRDEPETAVDGVVSNSTIESDGTSTLASTPSISPSSALWSFSGDVLSLSGWLKNSATYFSTILTDKSWLDLISKWLVFEQACRTEGVSLI